MTRKIQFQRLGLFDAKVPRYTSYPSAPHFKNDVTPAQFAAWIRAIPQDSEISLYLHIPFCRHLCWFCACRTQGTQTTRPVEAYLQTLLQELRLLADTLPKGIRLSRLHWGGGTPTLLNEDMISRLCAAIFDVIPLAENGEFSVEIDPNEIDQNRIDALAKAGMNRASIGVQDFDPQIQAAIGRIQSFEKTRQVIDMIRAKDVHSLNADILYGLPYQTPDKISESVQKLLSLSPDRVALYGYAHVPWMAKRQQLLPTDTLPTPQERFELARAAHDLFVWDGYEAIGIDHFAKPDDGLAVAQRHGGLRRNFQGYTDDKSEVLIGLGASSISRFPQGYAQNNAATSGYTSAIRKAEFSTVRGHKFSQEDRWRGQMIESLMCNFEIRSEPLQQTFAIDMQALTSEFEKIAQEFDNLPVVTQDGFFLPPEVRPLTRMIARAFDRYSTTLAQHSAAI